MEPLKAIVVGATGAVGSLLVNELLASELWSGVIIITRKSTNQFANKAGYSKLVQHVINMDNLEEETFKLAKGSSIAFCTLGVGEPAKVTKKELWTVDVEYASAFARGCKKANISHISLLSSIYLKSIAKLSYYVLAKKTVEDNFRNLKFFRTSFFRPSLLVTKNIRYGLKDYINQYIFPLISIALPSNLHEIKVENLAKAMRINAEQKTLKANNVEVLFYKDFKRLS